MSLNFRFGIVSDLHITLPNTIYNHSGRFHLAEVSIPAFEAALEHLTKLDLDFLLLPGDLTQHGELENHTWLKQRLAQLPFRAYVVPGNHDIPVFASDGKSINSWDFPKYYHNFGYKETEELYYICELLPGVKLIGLNSNCFHDQGQQIGRLDTKQLIWLEKVLATTSNELVLVMVHHNVIEHLPNQSRHPLASRYILENATDLLDLLRKFGVQLIFTGHLHIQDVASTEDVYEITTGSLISYPHPYRVLEFRQDNYGRSSLQILSHRIESLPSFPNLQQASRQWMCDHSSLFLIKLLTEPPLNLPLKQAEEFAPGLADFWAKMADGDAMFNYSHLPQSIQYFFNEKYGAVSNCGTPMLIDNNATLLL